MTVIVSNEDPAAAKAMRLYDDILDDQERRGIFQTTACAVVSYFGDGDPDHLTRFAESLAMTVRMRLIPEYQQAVREARNRPPARYEDAFDVEDVLADLGLRGGGGTR